VWFYDVKADGLSLDDKRSPLLPDDKQGAVPVTPLTDEEHSKNNLPDVLSRWRSLRQASASLSQQKSSSLSEVEGTANEADRPRTAQSFCVPKADIVAQGYDLSLNRYKEVIHEEVDHRAPQDIIADLARLEAEIQQGMKELEGLLASTTLRHAQGIALSQR
jgi:type I restriction enzyme M protein